MLNFLRKKLGELSVVTFGQLAVALIALLSIRLYTEILDLREFGAAMLVIGIFTLADSLIPMALRQTIMSKCAQYADSETQRQMAVGMSLLTGQAISALFLLITPLLILSIFFLSIEKSIFILFIFLFINVLNEIFKNSFLTLIYFRGRQKTYSAYIVAEAISVITITFFAIIYFGGNEIIFVASYVLSRVLIAFSFVIFFERANFTKFDLTNVRAAQCSWWRFGRHVAAMGPLGWASNYIDRYIIGAFLGARSTGLYAAISGLVSRPYLLLTSVLTQYFQPRYFRTLSNEGTRAAYMGIFKAWLFFASIAGLMGAAMFFLVGQIVVSIFLASEYRGVATDIMVYLALAQMMLISCHAADNALLSLGCAPSLLRLQLLVSIATFVVIPAGIYLGDVEGAAIARVITEGGKLMATASLAIMQIRNRLPVAVGQQEFLKT